MCLLRCAVCNTALNCRVLCFVLSELRCAFMYNAVLVLSYLYLLCHTARCCVMLCFLLSCVVIYGAVLFYCVVVLPFGLWCAAVYCAVLCYAMLLFLGMCFSVVCRAGIGCCGKSLVLLSRQQTENKYSMF